jgi:hypothetical protein
MIQPLTCDELRNLARRMFDMEDSLAGVRELNRVLYCLVEHMEDDLDTVAATRILDISDGFVDKVFEARRELCEKLYPFTDFSSVGVAKGVTR